MKTTIPLLDTSPEVEMLWDELNEAIQRVLRAGTFIMGQDVGLLEQELAHYLGVKHTIAVNSGTDAILIALRALNISDGDEVLTSPFTFFATAEPISSLGAKPVFVDIDPRTYVLDVTKVEEKITSRTKAIMPVHLYGQAVDMTSIRAIAERHKLHVIEDTAQAFGGNWNGQKLGTIGDIGTFSFFPSKNLGAYGDGGLIATNNEQYAEYMKMLRVHGARKKYNNEVLGYNSRLDTLQAAILRVKLPHVDEWNRARRIAAAYYDELLQDVAGIVTPFAENLAFHVYHQYTIRIPNGKRDAIKERLAEAGIATMVYYPKPVHQLPVYQALQNQTLPHSEQAALEVLSLPLWPQITPETQRRVVESLKTILESDNVHLEEAK